MDIDMSTRAPIRQGLAVDSSQIEATNVRCDDSDPLDPHGDPVS
jgi:hypothetical protein